MKALGRGSIASFLHTALLFAWVGLWVAAALVLGALGYSLFLAFTREGAINAAALSELGGAGWQVVVPALLGAGVAIGGGLVIVWRLRRLFESFSTGDPFRRENAQHLRVIWIALLIMELARYATLALFSALMATYGPPEGARIDYDPDLNLWNWAEILILIVLAEIFREGARLREEQELTI